MPRNHSAYQQHTTVRIGCALAAITLLADEDLV